MCNKGFFTLFTITLSCVLIFILFTINVVFICSLFDGTYEIQKLFLSTVLTY